MLRILQPWDDEIGAGECIFETCGETSKGLFSKLERWSWADHDPYAFRCFLLISDCYNGKNRLLFYWDRLTGLPDFVTVE